MITAFDAVRPQLHRFNCYMTGAGCAAFITGMRHAMPYLRGTEVARNMKGINISSTISLYKQLTAERMRAPILCSLSSKHHRVIGDSIALRQ